MHIKKSIKYLLILSILTNTCSFGIRIGRPRVNRPYTGHNLIGRPKNSGCSVLASLAIMGIATAIGTVAVALSTYFSYQRAKKQYEILKQFQLDYDYEKLKDAARSLYYDQWNNSSTSLFNDYPAIWLEKNATSNKNKLWWMFFSKEMKELSEKLHNIIKCLRDFKPFQKERKEYNDKYREQNYRDQKLAIEREKINQKKRNSRRR